jgi:glycosyltransferase involved in cell wall biosynthesis
MRLRIAVYSLIVHDLGTERQMQISIITVCYNAEETIEDTIKSVIEQDVSDIEYIIVDGGSTDRTMDIVQQYSENVAAIVSEKDDGLYDALNKGIALASGEIIGLLHADDVYSDGGCLEKVIDAFQSGPIDAVFADLIMVARTHPRKIRRYYQSRHFRPEMLKFGMMPPHPTFFVKRQCFERFGTYKTDYRIAADFELLLRFLLVHRIRYRHIPHPLITMRTGGISTKGLRSNLVLNGEIRRACLENNVKTNFFFIYLKYFIKVFQFALRPR